ncbi:hypothetical protein CgunFtcFv8_003942 [Champsocephalus gunnari]|uniref:ADP-ribosylation factor-like protein 15 n=1 Tax=Champsocephalus gunnari TaxID=52237 RepID=A0AAN8E2S4_CHAGU|nr:hypothetical protein CgunFtcFv8_003942 [Champsocephalus gunnari]
MDYLCFRALCCKGPPPPRPEYDVVCIGLTGAGKTSLLSRLCSEGSDGIVPTTGFSIKAVPFPNAILNVKELGGADNIKKYWSRYYQGSQGVVFVLDSASSDEELEAARNELHSALQHPQLCTLPFLILANHQDKPAARTTNQVKKYFELEPLARGKRWVLEGSSTDNLEAVKESFDPSLSAVYRGPPPRLIPNRINQHHPPPLLRTLSPLLLASVGFLSPHAMFSPLPSCGLHTLI